MQKILYCADKPLKNKPFPFLPLVVTRRIKDVYKKDYPLVIFSEDAVKNKQINLQLLQDKVCFINFSREGENNFELTGKFGFLDYLVDGHSKEKVLFKIHRAWGVVASRRKILNLERGILSKDKKLEKITLVDPSCDCYNWRYFVHRSQQELSRARRHFYNLSFIAVDIDYFRQVNELYGIKVADSMISDMVKIIKKILRKEDIVSRWRDDEFFIIMPYISSDNAYRVARRIKNKIAGHKFKYKKLSLSIHASIAFVSFPQDNVVNTADVVNALTKCLATAKGKGGNVIIPYSPVAYNIVCREKEEASVDELQERIKKMDSLLTRDLLEMIYGFAKAIEVKDAYTAKHTESTAVIAEKIARELSVPSDEIENVKRAAILHDLGKVGIDESILAKKGPLNKEEREVVKTHPWIATEILREIHALRGTIPAILYHHERFDGSGYPLGLKGEEIPLGARIIAVADVYQALISNRPYRKAFNKQAAIKIIREQTGKHFDPKIVDVFLKIVGMNKNNSRE
jgi:diguanylate cyclase (GGDEF)-like protein